MEVYTAQYAYAINCAGVLTHISNVVKHESYTCPGCNGEMFAAKGSVNIHHFRHNHATCSYETYLHSAAKNAFYSRYHETRNPIALVLERPISCESKKKHFMPDPSIRCVNLVDAKYNLQELFSQATLEQFDKRNGFTPDVMLSNLDNDHQCYIEICVTHKCTEEKIASGIPIIEITVKDENDIKYIMSHDFSFTDSNISLYNFRVKEKSIQRCHKNCHFSTLLFETWSLSSSGRLNKVVKSFAHLTEEEVSKSNCWSVDLDKFTKTRKLVNLVKVMDPRNEFHNCLKCINFSEWNDGKVMCSEKRTVVLYTDAKTCKYYEVDEL
ncbi:competence protein CoiA family protein [Shewanella halifaxensis]|uniref:competence protein CoiA family protein n=1 Tax=Shewanella halifaxensis TaxID=271098 RepID=UPI000D592394|nr:hypothetical protein [Shewanella halifaxensis]